MLGKNFFGVAEWERIGRKFSGDELSCIKPFPLSDEELYTPSPFDGAHTIREALFFFLGISRFMESPLTILQWHHMEREGFPILHLAEHPWCERDAFAATCVCRHLHWYAVLIEVVPCSLNLSLEAQKKLLNIPSYWVPSGIVEVTKNALYFLNHGFYLNRGVGATCADVLSDGSGVWVGADTEGKGITVEKRWDSSGRERIGTGAELRLSPRSP
ncbi:MAG: hypothetical protein HYW65_01470 [Candidatus Liptonbacteria bacterium]|nr:hypothetical protein [Candidatus Liptonbacteria bacterium]